jgi:FkbM family methyltransferase
VKLFQYYHCPPVNTLRSVLRTFGITNIFRHVAGTNSAPNEEAFQRALSKAIKPDDTVWDIGANVGYYTIQFLEWTEPAGKVIAFEPLPAAFNALKSLVDSAHYPCGRYLLHQAAITDHDEEVFFTTENTENNTVSTISHIADAAKRPEDRQEKVQAFRVDSLVEKLGAPAPNVTKIDVEGYEEEVIVGGKSTFSNLCHRELFIEIHFTRLAARNKPGASARIVKLLKGWGYRVEWLDASHLRARRLRS